MTEQTTPDARTVGAVLEQDHHRIDEHFAAFARALDAGTVDTAALATGSAALRHHIYVEETLHFPPLKAAGLVGPIFVMLREHGEIWDLLDVLDAGVADGGVADDRAAAELAATWRQLEQAIAAHNMKEEQIVYPAGDETLSEEVADDVLDILATADTPPGWVCQMAGRS